MISLLGYSELFVQKLERALGTESTSEVWDRRQCSIRATSVPQYHLSVRRLGGQIN